MRFSGSEDDKCMGCFLGSIDPFISQNRLHLLLCSIISDAQSRHVVDELRQ